MFDLPSLSPGAAPLSSADLVGLVRRLRGDQDPATFGMAMDMTAAQVRRAEDALRDTREDDVLRRLIVEHHHPLVTLRGPVFLIEERPPSLDDLDDDD